MGDVNQTHPYRARMQFGTGWLPDVPDFRDYTIESDEVKKMFRAVPSKPAGLASLVDLRQYCSPIEDQDNLGSCTAQAVGLAEYFERRTLGEYLDASRRFLYKVTRRLYRL